jgi:hypothetical protein
VAVRLGETISRGLADAWEAQARRLVRRWGAIEWTEEDVGALARASLGAARQQCERDGREGRGFS